MGNSIFVLVLLVFGSILSNLSYIEASNVKSMHIDWGSQNSAIGPSGDDLQLVFDQSSGSGAQSKRQFLFGSIEMLIKLVPGNSAVTVTAYYLSSMGNRHDEIDFEFLGNVSGQPYIIHTNIYTQGVGNREQQFYQWFDPTNGYHNYTIHWNPTEVVWYVDSANSSFQNYACQGIAYPNEQGMTVYASIWDADNWATRGGLVKIDWTCAPFSAGFQNFRPRACKWNGPASITQCAAQAPENWWTSPAYSQLSYSKLGQMKWVRDNYMIYDYCKETGKCLQNAPNRSSKHREPKLRLCILINSTAI